MLFNYLYFNFVNFVMNIETIKWIYQRISTPIILILFIWLLYKVFNIENYNYITISTFFNNSINLLLFLIFIFLSLLHTAIEVFHSIHDYFSETKNERAIKNITKILYLIIFVSIIIFISEFIFI